jgi:yeast amino acid transporter
MIAISGVVGVSIFTDTGRALEVAGPGGALVSYAFMGVVAIAVMECVSEMVQLFPVPNAMVEYVNAFLDPDLARVIGVAYWYTFSFLLLRMQC